MGESEMHESGEGFEEAIAQAVERHQAGGLPTLLVVTSSDGLAGTIVERLPPDSHVSRAVGAMATRAKVGGVAETLDLEGDAEGLVLVVENAQWADPSSLGRLQRLITRETSGVLLIVAHMPLADGDRWWLDQLESAAERHGTVLTTTVRAETGQHPSPPTAPEQRDLVLAAGLVTQPISVPVAARLLDASEDDALEVAESLVQAGLLTETRAGFRASAGGRQLEFGEARRGHMAGRLATVLAEMGDDPAVVGSLLLAGGDPEAAYPRLREAALAAQARAATGEAHQLAVSALEAARVASLGSAPELGELHLVCGRHLSAAGRSAAAEEHLDRAVSLLEGPARIDAMGFAAAVADNRQHPQDAERILAMAAWEALNQDEPAKLGSLGTFRARALNRIGFASESDTVLEKATTLLDEHATSTQRYYAEINRAWILFDRGQVAKAEAEFTHLRDLTEANDLGALADKEAWRARTLFATGRPAEALEAVAAARRLAAEAEVEAPLFLADLALAEGNLLFGRYEEAQAAADRVWDLVERQLPAWQNVARCNRALAFLGQGRVYEADSEIDAAMEATPSGANGWRWRSRCRAIQMEVGAAAGRSFPRREAEDLADLFLQSQFYGWAAEMLCVIAEQEKDTEAAREAMALAYQVGNPMLAARAAHVGKLWGEAGAAPVIRAVRAIEGRLPDGWEEGWKERPEVAGAREAPEPAAVETGEENADVLEEALRRAGLAGDEVLSPAQRRRQGLVRHRRRRRNPWAVAAAAAGVIALAAVTSVGVAQLTDPGPPGTTVVERVVESLVTTTAAPLALEETQIAVPEPEDELVPVFRGTAEDRGGPGRTGFAPDVTGPRTVDGFYWRRPLAGPVDATPVAYGNNVIVGSTDGTLSALTKATGDIAWTLRAEGGISASPALGLASMGEGQTSALVAVGGDDGIVRVRDAVLEVADEEWASPELGSRIRSAPVVADGTLFVASSEGFVHAFAISNGQELWAYPTGPESEGLGDISAGLAFDAGVLYVATEAGFLYLLDTATGELVCQTQVDGPVVANPIVSDGVAYIPTRANIIRELPAGQCTGTPADRLPLYPAERAVTVAPAIVGPVMYLPSGPFLYQIDLRTNEDIWAPSTVFVDGDIASPPVVTDDTVYFGTETGWVYAVDAESGEILWQWPTENYVRASPVVVDGAVFIASGDGNVYAVGPSDSGG